MWMMIAALLSLGACPAPASSLRTVEPRTSDRPTAGGSGDAHRAYPGPHRNRPAAAAHRFEHAHQTMGPGREGENFWTSTRDAFGYAEMVDGMIAERRYFINRPTPNFSTSGCWQDVAD